MIGRFGSMRTIECVITSISRQLQADGCIWEHSADRCTVISPDHLASGDYVKIRLWLPNEARAIFITLAEVRWVKGNWLALETIQISPQERAKLSQFVLATQPPSLNEPPVLSDHVLVRA